MKGLILNNLYMLKGRGLLMLAMWVIFYVVYAANHLGFIDLDFLAPEEGGGHVLFVGITLMLFTLAGLEAAGDAESSKWDVFQTSMPVKKWTIVASYYVTYVLLNIFALVMWAIFSFELAPMHDVIKNTLTVQFVGLIFYPLTFIFDSILPESKIRGYVLFIVAVALAVFALFAFVRATQEANILLWAIVVWVISFVVSLWLSVFFDKLGRRGFRKTVQGDIF